MQIGSLHVFPRANAKDQHCCVCNVILKPRTAFVHNYKVEHRPGYATYMSPDTKPRRPKGYHPVFTAQLYFCSPECVTLRALSGVYEEDF